MVARRLQRRSGATSPGSDCCFEDRRNGLPKRPSTASVHPAGIGPNISLVCSPARAGNGTQPILENHAVGPFLEVRAGEIYGPTSDRRNYQARLRGRGDRAFVESCRFDERAAVVVATVFGRRGNLRLRFPGSVRADSAYENILFFASVFRSRRARSASRSRRCHGTRASGNVF
jgi:hypothetical protein